MAKIVMNSKTCFNCNALKADHIQRYGGTTLLCPTTTKQKFRGQNLFNDIEIEAIWSACHQVWNEVAYDLLTAIAQEKGKDVNVISVPRSTVIEIVLDAGRPEQILEGKVRRHPEKFTEGFLERWDKLSYRARINLVKPEFPYATYGI